MTAKLPPEVEEAIEDVMRAECQHVAYGQGEHHTSSACPGRRVAITAACEKAYAAGQAVGRQEQTMDEIEYWNGVISTVTALENWGNHHAWCVESPQKENKGNCTCGYREARALAEKVWSATQEALAFSKRGADQ